MIEMLVKAAMLVSLGWSPEYQLIAGSYDKTWNYTYTASDNSGHLYLTHNVENGCTLSLVDPRGLEVLAESRTPGLSTCHITILDGQVVTADYTSGSLSVFPVDCDGVPGEPEVMYFKGSGPVRGRQDSAHLHSTWLSPDGLSLVAVDLGSDKLYRFGVRDGKLLFTDGEFHGAAPIDLPAGCGPRHCAFSPSGDRLYVITELSDEVLVLDYPSGRLLQRLPAHKENPNGGGHILLSPEGRFVCASVRVSSTSGDARCLCRDCIAVYERDASTGLLTPAGSFEVGGHPRHFTFAPDTDALKLVVACRDSDALQVFTLDPSTGLPQGPSENIPATSPDSVIFLRRQVQP